MKSFKLFFLLFITTFLNAQIDINKDLSLISTIKSFDKVHQNKIKSSVFKGEDAFKKLMKDQLNVNITFVDDENEIIKEFIKFKEYNCMVLDTSLYLQNSELVKKYSKDFFAFTNEDKFHNYIIVVNKDSNIKTINDLKGKRFANFTGNDNYSIWLDYITLKELKTPYKKIIGSEINVAKDSRLLLNIFFDKVDFTVIKKSVYEDMLQLNPSMGNKLKILKESEKIFIYALGFFHKKTNESIINSFYKYIQQEKFLDNLENVYKLLNQSSIQKIDEVELKKLESFYKEYQELKENR